MFSSIAPNKQFKDVYEAINYLLQKNQQKKIKRDESKLDIKLNKYLHQLNVIKLSLIFLLLQKNKNSKIDC